MIEHRDISDKGLRYRIRRKEICVAGNKALRIYGLLSCSSGKRMKRENRVFFSSVQEALQNGYRPCGNCMKGEYKKWRQAGGNF
ncbi:Ada metal-binding domain-containing protein [Chitinophaga sp.]|uniref:Ada metal-binding domain-containing protein n=1 Tax=Chitinophaga sp. TaxID=1869181 RepID=UPI0031E43E71